MSERIVGIFPALVARAAARILDEAVMVEIAVGDTPLQCRHGGRPQLIEELGIRRPIEGGRERAEVERRGVHRAVENARPEAAVDEVPAPNFVQDLAGLLLGVAYHLLALVSRKVAQRA